MDLFAHGLNGLNGSHSIECDSDAGTYRPYIHRILALVACYQEAPDELVDALFRQGVDALAQRRCESLGVETDLAHTSCDLATSAILLYCHPLQVVGSPVE